MNWQEFEDRLKAEGQKHRTPVDTDALWEQIRRKKRRRWLPFFWFLAGLAGLTGAGLLLNRASENQNLLAEKPHLSVHADSSGQEQRPPVFESAGRARLQNNRAEEGLTDLSREHADRTSPQPPETRRIAASTPVRQASRPRIVPSEDFLANKPESTPGASVPSAEDVYSIRADASVTMDPAVLPIVPDTTVLLSEPASQPAKTVFLPHLFIPLNPPVPAYNGRTAFSYKKSSREKSNPVYVGLQAGYCAWTLKRTPSGSAGTYPRSGEKTLSAQQVGLLIQLPVGSRWALRTGVQYTQYASVFRWSNQWLVSDSSSGGRFLRYDRQVQHYNRLQALAIPVDLQYGIDWFRCTLRPAAGLEAQVWQHGDGIVLRNGSPEAAYGDLYQRPFQLSLRFGIGLEAALGPKTRLVLEPSGRMDLLSRTNASYPAERFRQWGVHVGIMRQW